MRREGHRPAPAPPVNATDLVTRCKTCGKWLVKVQEPPRGTGLPVERVWWRHSR